MIANVVCRGFGPGASVAFVVTRGFNIGPAVVAATPPITTAAIDFLHVRTFDVDFRLHSGGSIDF